MSTEQAIDIFLNYDIKGINAHFSKRINRADRAYYIKRAGLYKELAEKLRKCTDLVNIYRYKLQVIEAEFNNLIQEKR